MIDILVTVDENYMQHLNVMLISLFENTKSKLRINCIFSNDIKKKSLEKLKNIIKNYDSEWNYYTPNDYKLIFDDIKNLKTGSHFKYTMYLRLFVDKILPKDIDKILYLDPDIIINEDIGKLFEIMLGEKYLGAVKEDYSDENKKRLLIDKNYYNSGVLLINLKKFRENFISDRIIEFIKKLNFENIIYPDQDIINLFFKENEILELDSLWNVHNEYLKIKNYKVDNFRIIHFTGSNKPWHYTNLHPYKKYYFNYLKHTEYSNFTYSDKNIKNIIKRIIKIVLLRKI